MNSIMANDGVRVNVMGGAITCSNGERYSLVGPVLMGRRGRFESLYSREWRDVPLVEKKK